MRVYIKSIVAISAQETFENNVLPQDIKTTSGWLKCISPEFKKYIPAKVLRRMNRSNRLCLVAANQAMSKVSIDKPDAIITATSNGCIGDSEDFLNQIIDNDETLLTPTSFIQSTHNAVGSNLALAYKCNGYNMVYTHQESAFESALQDGVMQLKLNQAKNILVGASDELTEENYQLKKQLGRWKTDGETNLDILNSTTVGTIPGEGATYMILSTEPDNAELDLLGVEIFYKLPEGFSLVDKIKDFLTRNDCSITEVDTFLLGIDGDVSSNQVYKDLMGQLPEDSNMAYYKHLCGDCDADGAFALWVASKMINTSMENDVLFVKKANSEIKKVLIVKQKENKNYSLMLVSAL